MRAKSMRISLKDSMSCFVINFELQRVAPNVENRFLTSNNTQTMQIEDEIYCVIQFCRCSFLLCFSSAEFDK